MKKIYLNPSEAMKELRNGATIRFDQNDGYSTIKKSSKDSYRFSVYIDNQKEPEVHEGKIASVIKTFNSPAFKEGLYVEEE